MYCQSGLAPDPNRCRATRHEIPPSWRTGVAAAALLLASVAQAAELPLTLAEAEDLALAAEPGREALLARAGALDERAAVAAQLPDPMLRIGLNNYPVQSGNFSSESMTNAGLGYRQSFPAGDTRELSARRYGDFADEMRGHADARNRDVLRDTRIAWLEYYYWSRAEALVTESRPFFDDLATITRSLYSVGRKTQQDVLRAELELSRLDDRLVRIERERDRARAMLGQWIGSAAERPPGPALPEWESLPPSETLAMQLDRHPLLHAADRRVSAGDTGVGLARQRSKPGWALDVGYSYREGAMPDGSSRPDMFTVGVTFELPYFRRRSVDATLTAALHERSAAEADRELLRRRLRRDLEIETARWHELSQRVDLYDDRILGQARDHARAALLAYQSDTGDFADVMRGYVDELNTRIDYQRLQVERAQTWAAIVNLGGLQQ